MKNYKYIFLSSIIIFMLTVIVHFTYDVLKFNVIAVLFPTNESIFQHMKMIYTSFIIFYLGLNIVKRRWKYNNLLLTNLISVSSTIIFFLIIYLPFRFRFGEVMIFTFILLFISIMVGQMIGYSFLKKEDYIGLNIISLIIMIMFYIIFAYLTFNPIHNDIFWDPEHETYQRVIKN